MNSIDPKELADRYVALWNQPESGARREAIRELWTEDGEQILQAPQDVLKTAAGLGFPTATFEVRGHDELEFRVTRSYEEFVAPGEFVFRSRDNAVRLRNIVKFNWEMVSVGGDVAGVGTEVIVLDEDGRIKTDYQFIES